MSTTIHTALVRLTAVAATAAFTLAPVITTASGAMTEQGASPASGATAVTQARAATSAAVTAGRKRLALTFDDAPRPAGALMSAESRTSLLLDALVRAGVDEAMFFVTTRNIDARGDEGPARLRRYTDAGHTLGNHSHTHPSANGLEANAFLADIDKAQRILAEYDRVRPLMRFPFLHEGNSEEKRDALRAGLRARDLKNGYVTIDNYDWYLQRLLDEAVRSGQPLNLDGWREVYVDVLLAAVQFYDDIAIHALGRRPAHVLLLHENELAALFVDDLVAALRADGWEIVPATDAFEDELSNVEPDTLFLGQGRVAAVAASQGRRRLDLVHPFESEPELRSMLVKRGLVGLASGAYLGQSPPGMTPRKFAPDEVSLEDRYEYGSVFSADGLEFFFAVARDGLGEIYTMRYEDDGWSPASRIFSHPDYSYADPFLSRDGTRLYFISTQPDEGAEPLDTYDLWYARRTRSGWSSPTRLEGPVNTEVNEYFVSLTDSGTLVFASEINAQRQQDFDLYLAEPDGEGFAKPERLPGEAMTRAYEADPFISPDGRYIIFSSTRRVAGAGRRDLYVTFRQPDGNWSRGVPLGNGVNTPQIEFCPFVTRDGRFLFYTSNQDLYWVDAGVIDLAREQLIGP